MRATTFSSDSAALPMFYVDDDMSSICVKVEDATLPTARHLAAQQSRDFIGDAGRSRFLGRVHVPMHEHEPAGAITDECGPFGCAEVDAWHFEVYEK